MCYSVYGQVFNGKNYARLISQVLAKKMGITSWSMINGVVFYKVLILITNNIAY